MGASSNKGACWYEVQVTETSVIPGTGTYFVGIDFVPGRYRCENGKNGWWVLFAGPAGEQPVGAWPLDPGPAEVDINPSDFAFETHVPTSWTLVSPLSESAVRPELRPVADPTLREELDRVVARRGALLRLTPTTILGACLLGIVLLGEDWHYAVIPFLVIAFVTTRLTDDLRRAKALRRRKDRYLTVDAFDAPAAELLARVQQAADDVRDSTVIKEGLLDGIDTKVELPRQEWEIAQVLARQAKLRRDQDALTLAPELAAALEPLQEKLNLSVEAVTRRVEALERYALRTREADAAYRACRQLEDLAAHAHEYDELLADTVRDDLAIPAIDRLTEQSDQLVETLQFRLAAASDAALDLPFPGHTDQEKDSDQTP
jgi:hypothetical protein